MPHDKVGKLAVFISHAVIIISKHPLWRVKFEKTFHAVMKPFARAQFGQVHVGHELASR